MKTAPSEGMNEDFAPDPKVAKRRGFGLSVVAIAMAAVILAIVWARGRDVERAEQLERTAASAGSGATAGSVGTSGSGGAADVDGGHGPSAAVQPAIIQELDTITGSVDGQQLTGRRVDLHVRVQGVPNEVAFWIGERDNRVLVVLGRDHRDGKARQVGLPPRHGISLVQRGQQATIAGSVQRLPKGEEIHNWKLTETDYADLLDRKVYVRADTVTTNGHGTH
jgi:hypothetical protein